MGCSTSKLEPEEQVAAEPAKAVTDGRRRFGSDLFGRVGRRNNNAGRRGRGEQQQQWAQGRKGAAGGSELSRSPGSPSFRYYCDDVVVVATAADERKGKHRR